MKVLIAQDIVEEGKAYLRDRGYEVVVSPAFDVETLKQQIVGCDGVLVRYAPFTAEIMEAADKLKVIGRFGIGVDNIDLEAATRLGIQVCNAPRANSNAVAEHTVGMALALTKNLFISDKETREGKFNTSRTAHRYGDLEGGTAGIVGLGQIGRLVAQKLHDGFGMKIMGYDAFPSPTLPDYIQLATPDEIYQQADIITMHVPSLPETHNMVSYDQFKMMKPTAIFINNARGAVCDEEALAWALENHVIAGAGVDAFVKEPLAADHPFCKLDNIILTPHTAALSDLANIRMGTQAAQGIDEVLSGKNITYPVNRLEIYADRYPKRK